MKETIHQMSIKQKERFCVCEIQQTYNGIRFSKKNLFLKEQLIHTLFL